MIPFELLSLFNNDTTGYDVKVRQNIQFLKFIIVNYYNNIVIVFFSDITNWN